jgi:hypothetical protein
LENKQYLTQIGKDAMDLLFGDKNVNYNLFFPLFLPTVEKNILENKQSLTQIGRMPGTYYSGIKM